MIIKSLLIPLLMGSVVAQASVTSPESYANHIKNGEAAFKAGKMSVAEKEYEIARALDGKKSAPVLGLALVAENQKKFAEAQSKYQLCLKLDSGNQTCKTNLARLDQQEKKKK